MTVYIVMAGEDCEGAYIEDVFAKKEDAIAWLDHMCSKENWISEGELERRKTYMYNGKRCKSAFSAWVTEWEVRKEGDTD